MSGLGISYPIPAITEEIEEPIFTLCIFLIKNPIFNRIQIYIRIMLFVGPPPTSLQIIKPHGSTSSSSSIQPAMLGMVYPRKFLVPKTSEPGEFFPSAFQFLCTWKKTTHRACLYTIAPRIVSFFLFFLPKHPNIILFNFMTSILVSTYSYKVYYDHELFCLVNIS